MASSDAAASLSSVAISSAAAARLTCAGPAALPFPCVPDRPSKMHPARAGGTLSFSHPSFDVWRVRFIYWIQIGLTHALLRERGWPPPLAAGRANRGPLGAASEADHGEDG